MNASSPAPSAGPNPVTDWLARFHDPACSPSIMGILNVTPDSFSDGGDYVSTDRAVARACEMIAEGADLIDVGPESTRPFSREVPVDEQLRRAIPVIETVHDIHPHVPISIDTRRAAVARKAVEAGAVIINDVSALGDDPSMVDFAVEGGVVVILVHRRGTSETMQIDGGPRYDDVVGEVLDWLTERARWVRSRGLDPRRILIDPGLGFGKRTEHNLLLLRHLERFVALGHPVVVGASRKRFLGSVLGGVNPGAVERPGDRLNGSLACAVLSAWQGAAVIRVHDVRATVEAVRLATAVRNE